MRHYIVGAIAFVLVACSSGPSPETEAAISALKGLNSKLDVGLNLAEYKDAVRDAKVIIDQAIEADPKSKTNQVVQKVMDGHIVALELWRCQMERDIELEGRCTKEVCETLIFPLYPEIKEIPEFQVTLGVIQKGSVRAYFAYSMLDHEKVLQHLWYLNEEGLNSLESK